jgi:broad specificity phosphatase PhoE
MSTRLILVRHGQASALSDDYDQLSELGKEQSRYVGPWLARWVAQPAHVLVGPRRRHSETYEEAMRMALAEGVAWPAAESTHALDEHHAIQLMHSLKDELATRNDELGELARTAFTATNDARRHWLRLFRVMMLAWARGELAHHDVEPWADFRARIRRVVEDVSARRGTVIAFTSGGAIGACVSEVLGLDESRTLDLCWAIKNASITEIEVNARGASLVTFNAVGHLNREDLMTRL